MKKTTVLKAASVPAILGIGFLAMQALGSTRKESNRREVEPETRAVEVQRLEFGDLTLRVEGDGVIESERELELVSEAAGRVTYAKNDLKDGTFVRKGEVVVRLDSRDVENQLFSLRSEFMNAVASALPELRIDQAEIYKRWFDYFQSLDINQRVPELPPITNAQEKMKVSSRDIIGKYYDVRNQEILLSKYVIRAPFDGYITSNGVIENTFVSTGQPLFTLTDPKHLAISVPLLVEESQSIDFTPPPEARIYPEEGSGTVKLGRVARKRASVDRNSQTLYIYVTFENPELDPGFLPGKYVHVAIQGRRLEDVATVPRHLVQDGRYLFTMEPDGTLGRQEVDIAGFQGDLAILRNTVPEDTRIVTTILQKPLLGMKIRPIEEPESTSRVDLAGQEQRPTTSGAVR